MVGDQARPRSVVALLTALLAAVLALAACGGSSSGSGSAATSKPAPSASTAQAAPPVGPHGGLNLRVLLVTDGKPAVQAIRQQLVAEGVPITVINLRESGHPRITRSFLARSLPGGGLGGNFNGVVLPDAAPAGLSAAEQSALASYERRFGVRQVDAYTPPTAAVGMSTPVYTGPLRGTASVTTAGASAGFGYLRNSFPFSGGAAGPPPFGYLARPLAGATPLLDATGGSAGSGTLVWQFSAGGRQQLGIGFGYSDFSPEIRFLAPGIIAWVTRGVHLGYWRSYLTVGYDDVIAADARWSRTGRCTPGGSKCPPGTPATPLIRMKPADVRYAVAWQRQHHFIMEFLFNGGSSVRFQVRGTDPLLAAFRPVARDFYWVNHTYTHADLGCKLDFAVLPPHCTRTGGHIAWASYNLINSQIVDNLSWAKKNGIPVVPGVLATGEYSGLRILPQQPADNPNLIKAINANKIRWVAMDASRDPNMRPVGMAYGVPRHPIDVGYDVDTIADEVNEYNWFHTSKQDGGSGLCEKSKVTACIKPLNPKTGWTQHILPTSVQIVFAAMLDNDPRSFFMHQSNLTGDRLGYPVMDRVLSAYHAVFRSSAPVINLSMAGDGAALHDQGLWAAASHSVTAWVQGKKVTVSGPFGATVAVTVPAGTRVASAGGSTAAPSRGATAGSAFGGSYAGTRSAYTTLGQRPLRLTLAAPVPQTSS